MAHKDSVAIIVSLRLSLFQLRNIFI